MAKNKGEFQVVGTYLDIAQTSEPYLYEMDETSHSIRATDNRDGTGFILYSVDDLENRFGELSKSTDEHFTSVVYQNNKW